MNGITEKMNRMIKEPIKTLFSTAKLPDSYWAETAQMIVYIKNRISIRSNISLYEY